MSGSQPSSQLRSSPSIIIVDDESDIVRVFAKSLQGTGYDVNGFSDPEKAADFFAANTDRISLVITDLRMPNMSGIELASRIRVLGAKVKIILMTAFETTGHKEDIERLDFSSVIRKPVTPANFKIIVEKTLSM